MKDTEKAETTVANIKAAHAKGCSTVKEALETLYPEVFKKMETYSIGQRFKVGGTECILALVEDYRCCLIPLDTGNRRSDPITVLNFERITREELNKMSVFQITKL